MSQLKQPYELSLWQDNWDTTKSAFTDKKILVLGNNLDKKVHQAQSVTLTRNVNGTSTLSFVMYYKYRDELTGELLDNPFISMMVNERKIKIKYGKEWNYGTNDWVYEWKDFFIKTAQEASDKKSITYTCKDSFITELSKNGFAIEMDQKLENNQGTVTELAEVILEDTDWSVGESGILQQRVEDYVYEVTTRAAFTAMSDGVAKTIPTDSKILIYYSTITKKDPYFQFLYSESGVYEVDSERIVLNAPEYSATAEYLEDPVNFIIYIDGVEIARISLTQLVSTAYKGMRYVRLQKTFLDPVTSKYVTLHSYNNDEVYCYTTTEYLEPLTVTNYVTNNKEMISAAGWYGRQDVAETAVFVPAVAPFSGAATVPVYLQVQLPIGQSRFMNTGLKDNRALLSGGLALGEKFTMRLKYKMDSMTGAQSGLTAVIARYDTTTMDYVSSSDIVCSFSSFRAVGEYAECTASITKAVSQSELYGDSYNYGIFFTSSAGRTIFLKDVQLFKTVFDDENIQVYPETINVKTLYKTIYHYYKPDPTIIDPAEIQYIYRDETPLPNATVLYDENFEKIRSVTASKSNRFNLIQQLAEIFECWADFQIGHNDDGSLKLIQQDGVWVPDKKVTFVEFLGQENSLGFRYGLNLNSIQRNVESEQIVTKLIVEKNANEFAEDGFCTIAYAKDNLQKEAFIFNFDYFIQHGLLDQAKLLKDLYVTIGSEKGYLANLRDKNLAIETHQDLLPGLYRAIDQQAYMRELYSTMLYESTALANNSAVAIMALTKISTLDAALEKVSKTTATETEQRYYQEYMTYQSNIKTAQSILDKVEVAILDLEDQIVSSEEAIKDITIEKRRLNLDFYKRYSRFIQEGSWIDENYIDHDLYYLDAQSVLYNSAFPQVSYTINVIDLSALPEYRHYTYRLGDKTTIEDTEFFGYSDYATRTPYKEQVIISEITTNFDDPRNNRITIQNFKSQFQDLFQRITASTNSLQYNNGSYQRAAQAITPSGEIEIETLQNSLINNSLIISSAQNESFIQDSNGITAIDLDDPLNVMKLQSKGLFLSTDGGETWTAGIRANGINTQALTAGSILVDKIMIQGTGSNAFRWDEHGLNAYSNLLMGGRATHSFVRFDNYGIYGINRSDLTDGEYVPENEQAVWDDAQFGMTWRGFFIKNKYGSGWVEVSSENDVAIYDGTIQRIKLGNIGGGGGESSPVYGFVVRDESGNNRVTLGNIGTYNEPQYGLKIQDSTGEIGVLTDENGKFYGQHIYIGPRTYDTRAELGVINSYIGSIDTESIFEYSSETEYATGDIVSYQGVYYKVVSSYTGEKTLPIPGTSDDWSLSPIEYSKILSIKDTTGTEQISLFDDGRAVFRQADVSGNINAMGGRIGGFEITESGFQGLGFSINYDGVSFDMTANPDGFRIYDRTPNVFNPSLAYNVGDIVVYDGGTYIAMKDMPAGTATTPTGVTDSNWNLNNEVDPNINIHNIFTIENGKMTMDGQGTFTGVINADSGYFKGDLYAQSGYIGGLILSQNSLYSGNARSYSTNNTYFAGEGLWYQDSRYIAKIDIPAGTAVPPGETGWEQYWELDADYGISESPFSIDAEGNVIADSIVLGTSASIKDFLQLGDSFIYNPTVNNNQFISVNDSQGVPVFSLDNAGLMTMGQGSQRIYLNGANSTIRGNSWSITPDEASFSNVSVSGTIRTTVFKKDSVQSINSSLILATSSTVKDFDFDLREIWVDYVEGQYQVGDWVIIADNTGKVPMQINALSEPNENGLIMLDFLDSEETGTVEVPITVTRIGQKGDFNIGINASNASVLDVFAPRAITMSQLEVKDGILSSDYKVVLGKLNGISQLAPYLPTNTTTDVYGLYSDFAYLKGSIVGELPTEGGPSIYTGINTLNGVVNKNPSGNLLYESIKDDSRVVFWAGASGLSDIEIQDAPFKVTEAGYMYARKGVFAGSVLSDSVITNSVIVTNSIYLDRNSSSLHIFDTNPQGIPTEDEPFRGIIFAKGLTFNETDGSPLTHEHRVGIGDRGVELFDVADRTGVWSPYRVEPLIDANGKASLSSISLLDGIDNETTFLKIEKNKIENKGIETETQDVYLSQILFDPIGSISFNIVDSRNLEILKEEVRVKPSLKVEQDLVLGSVTDEGMRMSYRKVTGGYDLYIEEE